MIHPHAHIHHSFDHPSHWAIFFGYFVYAILVLGISLIFAALAYQGKPEAPNAQSPTTAQHP